MSFITLDNKDWCKGVYHDGRLHFEQIPENLDRTWKYCSYLENKKIEYAAIYAMGKNIEQVCPSNLSDEWKLNKSRLEAYHSSFKEAKISLEENCFFDLVPKQFLLEICNTKCKIIDYVIDNFEKPKNYEMLLAVEKIISQIERQELNLDLKMLKSNMTNVRARNLLKKLNKTSKIKYNLFGSKTGRLTTSQNTFPILNLDKEFRSIIKPNNDLLVELDFNSAEVRVLFALSNKQQPEGDVHNWNAKRFSISREEAKKEIFAWLYGSSKIDSSKYEKWFSTKQVIEQYYSNECIVNPFGRKIKTDDFHKMNHLIQSTTADMVFEQVIKVNELLKNKKSFVSFMVHDSVVIDLAKEELEIVKYLLNEFTNTRFGKIAANISAGKDYGSLRRI